MTPGQTPGSTPTTPGSAQGDPFDDQLWLQFLTGLNSDGSSDFNKILDTDDAADDPDFIVAGDNCFEELLDPDDERIQVPKSETVALVKDTFDFCGTVVPIGMANEEHRMHKSKSGLTSILRRNTNESFDSSELLDSSATHSKSSGLKRLRFQETAAAAAASSDLERSIFAAASTVAADPNASDLFDYFNSSAASHAIIATFSETATSAEPRSVQSTGGGEQQTAKSTTSGNKGAKSTEAVALDKSPEKGQVPEEYIPELTDQQRQQLDEQMRNHVQLLAQTCLANYPIDENKQIFNDAFGLLKILDQLTNNGWEQEQEEAADQPSTSDAQTKTDQSARFVLSPEFKIINLNEALDIVNNLANMDKTELSTFDSRHGIPSKFLEIMVNSPVFYNTSLLPKCRYDYQSQYKRAQFFDSEKILLIMGYNKFKHLSKKECCQCIRDHLLPHRSTLDIKKQLSSISNSEQRQLHFKELVEREKEKSEQFNRSYEFSVEANYKSPLEQSNRVQLPSMYTLEIERSKMGHMLKNAREKLGLQPYKPREPKNRPKKAISRTVGLVEITDENRAEAEAEQRKETSSDESEAESPAPLAVRDPSPVGLNQMDETGQCESENEDDLTITFAKNFKRASSPTSPSPSRKKFAVLNSTLLNETPSHHSTVPCNTPVASNRSKKTTSKIEITKVTQDSRLPSQLLSQPIILQPQGSSNVAPIFIPETFSPFNINGLMKSICVDSSGARFIQTQPRQPVLKQANQLLAPAAQQPSIMIPTNFAGTVLFQPTIHIHMTAKSSQENLTHELKKYRTIVPKSGTSSPAPKQSPANKPKPASKRS